MVIRRFVITSTVLLSLYPGKIVLAATFGEKMANAGLNTLLGMGTVFIVLIFICMIIHCFKYISIVQEKINNIKETITEKPVAPIEENIVMERDELLIAITAAIADVEEVSVENLVVQINKKRISSM